MTREESNAIDGQNLAPSHSGYDRTRTTDFYRQLETRVRALPGLQSASLASNPPIAGFPCKSDVFIESRPSPPGQSPANVLCNNIGSFYFETLRIPVLRGRAIAPSDDENGTALAIVNQTMAQRFWPGEDPIGKRFSMTRSG